MGYTKMVDSMILKISGESFIVMIVVELDSLNPLTDFDRWDHL